MINPGKPTTLESFFYYSKLSPSKPLFLSTTKKSSSFIFAFLSAPSKHWISGTSSLICSSWSSIVEYIGSTLLVSTSSSLATNCKLFLKNLMDFWSSGKLSLDRDSSFLSILESTGNFSSLVCLMLCMESGLRLLILLRLGVFEMMFFKQLMVVLS